MEYTKDELLDALNELRIPHHLQYDFNHLRFALMETRGSIDLILKEYMDNTEDSKLRSKLEDLIGTWNDSPI